MPSFHTTRQVWTAALSLCATLCASCQQQGDPNAPEPMELQGRWLGMAVAGTDSPSAQAMGVPAMVKGVVVTEVLQQGAENRAAAAGIAAGDVIAAVDGQPVTNLAELYTLSTRQDTQKPLAIDLVRSGQPMRAMMPAAPGLMSGMASAAPGAAPQFYCPTDAVRWSQADVAPSFRCPRCGGPVTSIAP